MSHTVGGQQGGESGGNAMSGRRPSGKRGRIQPYSWLGVGAVTIGLGAGMIGGAGLAFADTDGGSGASTSSDSSSSSATKSDSSAASRGHSARKGAASSGANRSSRVSAAQKSDDVKTPDIDTASDAPAAAAATDPEITTTAGADAATESVAASKVAESAVRNRALPEVEVASPAASVPLPAASVTLDTAPWVDGSTITSGSSVALAKLQLQAAQDALNAQTWDAGNVFAGLVSLAPQFFLNQASASLTQWGTATPQAQQFVADTMNIPVIHQVAQLSLLSALALPSIAVAQMNIAAMLIPLVGVFGASAAATQANALVTAAQSNGRVYGVVPIVMKANTEPVVYITLNNGQRVPVLIDTGASGLIISPTAVGNNFGTPVSSGTSGFSGGLTYKYNTYDNVVVDFGNGVTTAPTAVNVVSPDDAAVFDNYFAPAGVVGVLGIGANAVGPGPSLPNAAKALPGELGNGVLIYQDAGVMIFGPNPFPAWAVIPGAPNGNVQIQIGNGPKQTAMAIIDSGGVYGTLPIHLNGGSSSVPSGTKISVYTSDGQTLLYTYTTQGIDSPTVVPSNNLHNTGNEPFDQFPIYIDYDPDDSIGRTVFTYF